MDADRTGAQIDIVEIYPRDLRSSDAARVKQLHNRVIASAPGIIPARDAGSKQFHDIRLRENFREFFADFGPRDFDRGIVGPNLLQFQELIERLKRG